MAHLTEAASNIVDSHITGIESVTAAKKVFLFIRKGTKESCALIKTGRFPTKSMDIHDKSSDWGPMAGLVPCDPFFCKKNLGTPKAEKTAHAYHANVHGTERPVHLPFDADIFRLSAMQPVQSYMLRLDQVVLRSAATREDLSVASHVDRIRGQAREVAFYSASKNGKQTYFCVRDRLVYWIKWTGGGQTSGELFPVWVWAYPEGPVTGDYDLWMVSPYFTDWKNHTTAFIFKDEHTKEQHAGSAVTTVILELVEQLNQACKRSHKPVFRHGAEAQNYGFTQGLDDSFLMFTPGGTSQEILRKDMPMVLADIQNAGYLVYWNKRYGEADPKLGGEAWNKRAVELEGSRGKFKFKVILFKELMNKLRFEAEKKDPARAGKARFRYAVHSVINRKDPEIRKFYTTLRDLLSESAVALKFLRPEDFGPDFTLLEGQKRSLLQDAQRLAVEATAETGTGQSDAELLKAEERLFELAERA